jgi:Holliday junction resolvasome RuvABC endonuclease subunit
MPIDKSTVLALDVATITGFATATASGVWNLTPKRDESSGMRLIRFKSKLAEMVAQHGIKCIIFERTAGQHKAPIIVQSELHGVLKLFCEEQKIEYKAYSAAEIKKFATGKGNANKIQMIAAAKEKYGIEINNDNQADALHIYHFALHDLGLNERLF